MQTFIFHPGRKLATILATLVLLGMLVNGCTRASTPEPAPSEEDLQAEEELVYEALFSEIFGEPRMYVLMEKSSPGMDGVEGLEAIFTNYLTKFTDLEDETAASFRLRNGSETSLPADMELALPYVLLTRTEFDEIFALNTSGWNVFYTRYPNSPGMITVSRVGFNNALTQSVVYAGTWSNWLAGAGFYYLLEKVDDAWQVVEQVMAWVS